MKRITAIVLLVLAQLSSFAQSTSAERGVEMADVMRSNGKIYVVVGVVLMVLVGVFTYLVIIDRKVKSLENKLKN